MLSVILSRHPDIDIDGNSIAFRLVSCFGYYKDVLPYNLSSSRTDIQSWLIRHDYKGRLADMLDHTDLDQFPDARCAIRDGIEKRLRKNGKKVFGDKSPGIEHHMSDLLMLVPEARFIHIVRDGRAVALSKTTRTNKHLHLAAQEWVDGNIVGLSNQAMIGEDRYRIIRYEDLLLKPEATVRDLCHFLKIAYDPCMTEEDHDQTNERSYVGAALDLSKIDSYKEQLTSTQLKRIENLQAPLLERFGYDLTYPRIGVDHKQLSIATRIWYSQLDNVKQLFIGKQMGMSNRENVEMTISFVTRLKTFIFQVGWDLLPARVFKRVFRKRWIKDVYLRE